MTTFHCSTCKRTFDEAGFCPFDRTQLVASAVVDAPTVMSTAMAAVSPDGPHKTDVERRGTFPLTPSADKTIDKMATVVAPVTRDMPSPSQEPTNARQPIMGHGATPVQLRAVSASENPADALSAYRDAHPRNEYDRLVGETLDGRYFVEKKIGEGGMGVVFSARHAVIERPLAIKVLKREVMRDTATIRRFVQEAKAASRIGHPNIVDVTDFGTTPDGMTYSVMEYVDGETLGQAIRGSAPFPPLRALRISAQIARALGAAHDKGIVHRDLKPENVFLVDRDGRPDFVKIVDFGIAKVLPVEGSAVPNQPRLTRAGSVFGTPEYMAPEQAAGRSDTDGRVDIYALGVILYEMLCARVPHKGDSMVRTLAMQMLDPVEPPSRVRPDLNIAPELEAVVMMALAKKRDQRYQTMGEMLIALDRVAKEVLPPPVGQSVTGSPVYALSPLPPGADPNTVVSQPAVQPSSGVIASPAPHDPSGSIKRAHPISQSPDPRGKAGSSRRLRDEPEFVTNTERAHSFDHLNTEDMPAQRARRWPLVLLFALIVGGAGGAILLMSKHFGASDDNSVALHRDAAVPAPSDAKLVVETSDDAALVVDNPPSDADLVDHPPSDADLVVIAHDANHAPGPGPGPHPTRHVDGGTGNGVVLVTPNLRGTLPIQILTKPEGAVLYEGTLYRGPGGTTIEANPGTRMDITCKHPGYSPGTVTLVYDGKTDVVLCVAKRIKICIDNVKNPFDDCELDPTKPIPDPSSLPSPAPPAK